MFSITTLFSPYTYYYIYQAYTYPFYSPFSTVDYETYHYFHNSGCADADTGTFDEQRRDRGGKLVFSSGSGNASCLIGCCEG